MAYIQKIDEKKTFSEVEHLFFPLVFVRVDFFFAPDGRMLAGSVAKGVLLFCDEDGDGLVVGNFEAASAIRRLQRTPCMGS